MLTKQELNRKLLHLIALLMPVGIFYVPKINGVSKWIPPLVLGVLFFGAVLLEKMRFKYPKIQILYLRCFHSLLRNQEKKKMTGATYIIGGALVCAIVFIDAPHISFMTLTLFILGDGVAAIVGISIGRIALFGKTIEGSLACFGLCMTLFAVLFPHVPFLLEDWRGAPPFSLMIITSLAITIFELIPIKITRTHTLNDNLYVPVIAGLVLDRLQPFF